MTEVTIPFLEQFRKPMLTDWKTMTSRTKKYGDPGDTFRAFGERFEILSVGKMRLHDVAFKHFYEEGCLSVQEFTNIWEKIHPRIGFVAQFEVFAHTFKRIHTNTRKP